MYNIVDTNILCYDCPTTIADSVGGLEQAIRIMCSTYEKPTPIVCARHEIPNNNHCLPKLFAPNRMGLSL